MSVWSTLLCFLCLRRHVASSRSAVLFLFLIVTENGRERSRRVCQPVTNCRLAALIAAWAFNCGPRRGYASGIRSTSERVVLASRPPRRVCLCRQVPLSDVSTTQPLVVCFPFCYSVDVLMVRSCLAVSVAFYRGADRVSSYVAMVTRSARVDRARRGEDVAAREARECRIISNNGSSKELHRQGNT